MQIPIYRSTSTGVYFLTETTPKVANLRGGAFDGMVLHFKLHGKRADFLRTIVEALRVRLGCDVAVGIPPADDGGNWVQRITGDEIRFRPRHARPKRHNDQSLPLNDEAERTRVELVRRGGHTHKVLLVDDVFSTGQTMECYRRWLEESGAAREVVPFVLGMKKGRRFEVALTLEVEDIPEVEDPEEKRFGTIAALSRAVRIPASTLRLWRDRGIIRADEDGLWNADDVLAAAEEWAEEKEEIRSGKSDADDRLKLARARREELRLAEDRRRLLDTAEVREGLASVLQPLLIQLGNVSHRCPVVEARDWLHVELTQIVADARARAEKTFVRHPRVDEDDGDD